jgi:hypothetical protein
MALLTVLLRMACGKRKAAWHSGQLLFCWEAQSLMHE